MTPAPAVTVARSALDAAAGHGARNGAACDGTAKEEADAPAGGMDEAEGAMWSDMHAHADEALERLEEHVRAVRAHEAGLLSEKEIFAPLPPVKWLCQPLDMAPGAPALVAGYGFSGKTLAVQDLALAVASGTAAWGRLPVRSGRVLHLDYEQGQYLTRLRYQRLARARGIDSADLSGRLMVAVLPEWYLDKDTSDMLPRLCEGFDLAIVDSFRAASPFTDENASGARIPLDRLGRISDATGVTVVVLHHARKPTDTAKGGPRMSVRGSGALYDACGSVLVFSGNKGDPPTVSHEKARISGRPHEDFRLWIEDVEINGDPNAGLRVSYLDAPASPAKQSSSDRLADVKRRVLDTLREAGSFPGGASAMSAQLSCRKESVLAAVAELEAEGLIVRAGSSTRTTLTYAGTDADPD